jgi:tetratricopeptide (TPR) repeat protein
MSKSMTLKPFLALVASLALFAHPLAFAADALLKPLPDPDTSKLPPASAKEVREAHDEFEKIRPTLVGDDLAQAYALLGAHYARAGLYTEAATALGDAAMLAPDDSRWAYAQGFVARMQKQNPVAKAHFERALSLDKEYLPIRVALANMALEQNDFDGAHKLLSDYTATHEKDAFAFAMLGDIALRQNRYPDAIEQTNRALKLDPSATKLYGLLADAYKGAGNTTAATAARAKVGNGVPALGDPIGLGLIPQAASSTTPAAAADTGSAALPGNAAVREASVFLATHNYDQARSRLDAALKATPNDADVLGMYARVEAAAGNMTQAKMRAQAAVAAAPNNMTAQLTLGYVLEMSNDDAGAQRAYEKAATLDPKSPTANLRLGNLLMRNGRFDDAAVRYRAATQAASGNGEAWSRMIAAETAAGKCAAALSEVNAALAKDANNGVLLQLFVRLTSTCANGGKEEKAMALDYAARIYKQASAPQMAETYALALAANGKWDDAVKTQEAAMFVLVRNGRSSELVPYRQFLQQFRAHQVPDRPWAPDSPMYKVPRPAPDPKTPPPSAKAPAQPPKK